MTFSTVPSRGYCATLCGAYLDEVLAFGLGNERLELRCSERVDQASLRDHQE